MTLASGIVNLFWGLGLSLTVLVTVVGVVCTPFTILPTILGVFEIIYAAKLMQTAQAVQPSNTIAILEMVCILAANLFSVVVGILALVFYNDLTVRDYFARLNGTPIPTAVAAVPAATLEPKPDPVMSEETSLLKESKADENSKRLRPPD